jgi:hypothetical protein
MHDGRFRGHAAGNALDDVGTQDGIRYDHPVCVKD